MFKIKIKGQENNLKVIILEGSLDNTTVIEMESVLDSLIKQSQAPFIIMDLSKLDYLNSTGIANLLQYYTHTTRAKQGCFKLFGLSSFIQEILDACGVTKLLEIYATEDEAVRSLGCSTKH